MSKKIIYFNQLRSDLLNDLLKISNKKEIIDLSLVEKSETETNANNIIRLKETDDIDEILSVNNEDDFPLIAKNLISLNRLDDALILTKEIYNYPLLWGTKGEGLYRSYLKLICSNAISINDLNFLKSINKVLDQWCELNVLQDFGDTGYLTQNEILAQEFSLIISTYVKLAQKNTDKEIINKLIKSSINFFNSIEKELKSDFLDIYEFSQYLFYKLYASSGIQIDGEKFIPQISFIDDFDFTNFSVQELFNFLFAKYLNNDSINDTDINSTELNHEKIEKEIDNISQSSNLFSCCDISNFSTDENVTDIHGYNPVGGYKYGYLFYTWPNKEQQQLVNGDFYSISNSGQSGSGPFLFSPINKKTHHNIYNNYSLSESTEYDLLLIKSSICNMLFLCYCKIDLVDKAFEQIKRSIEFIRNIKNSDVKSRAYYLISTVFADSLRYNYESKNTYKNLLNHAFYFASLVKDKGDFACFCHKYNGSRYKGIVCDNCNRECSEWGYKKNIYDYIKFSMNQTQYELGLSHDIINKIFNNTFSDSNEILNLAVDILALMLSKNYLIDNQITMTINTLKLNNLDSFLKSQNMTSFEWYVNNFSDDTSNHFKGSGNNNLTDLLFRLFSIEFSSFFTTDDVENRFNREDLNTSYQQYLIRSNRLNRLLEIKAPEVILEREKALIKKAFDAVMEIERKEGVFKNKVIEYLNFIDKKRILLVIPKLLSVYVKMLRKYNMSNNKKDFNNCLNHYLEFLHIISDENSISYASFEILKLFIDINKSAIDENFNLIDLVTNRSDLDKFCKYYVKNFTFGQCVLFYKKIKIQKIRDVFSDAVISNIDQLKNTDFDQSVYFAVFYNQTKSLRNYLLCSAKSSNLSNDIKNNLSQIFQFKENGENYNVKNNYE